MTFALDMEPSFSTTNLTNTVPVIPFALASKGKEKKSGDVATVACVPFALSNKWPS